MQRKINLTQVIYLRIGKTYTAKTPLGDFKVTILENPLLSKQAVTSKGISVLTVESLPQYLIGLVL